MLMNNDNVKKLEKKRFTDTQNKIHFAYLELVREIGYERISSATSVSLPIFRVLRLYITIVYKSVTNPKFAEKVTGQPWSELEKKICTWVSIGELNRIRFLSADFRLYCIKNAMRVLIKTVFSAKLIFG